MAPGGPPADFGKLIADETGKWGKVIKLANIRLDGVAKPGEIFRIRRMKPKNTDVKRSDGVMRSISSGDMALVIPQRERARKPSLCSYRYQQRAPDDARLGRSWGQKANKK
jgi:hypothetical protein